MALQVTVSLRSHSGSCRISIQNRTKTIGRVVYPEVGPGLGHLQLPVVLPMCEALKAEHLPRVVEARFVGRDGARPGGQVLRLAVLLRQKQVPVGRAGVEGQRAAVCCAKQRNQTDCRQISTVLACYATVAGITKAMCDFAAPRL